ncbi:PEP/pyruvate-binding domain-containing protein, partial [Microbacterium sp. Bi128]|uniref:PEP/pyruvate-binding domain-containing protein n=1 Tax=Microbacterium sp. Bi128 TaxID=2821115 RepID=UPI001E489979
DGVKAVTEHIRQCWASLFTSRAIIYRLKNNIPNEGLSMAVVVQKMVNARVSGVAITMDPTNGDRSKITIDSSYGVGEMVVSGQVTPDNIMLDKVTLAVVSEHLGDKHAELVPDAVAGRLVEREVDAERRGRRSLTGAELTAVAQMAKRAEKHYKCPQDIEWALDADLPDGENLLLLQSRPETVHSSKPVVPSSAAAGGYFSGLSPATSAAAPASPTTPATTTPAITTPAGPAPSSATGFSLGSITASLLKPSS